jgi:NAD(P)-dependent dehydrogenase (short-subunit alcohol dehydrogenase family)
MNTIFISGASRGIGLELCKQLLNRDERVIAGCRDPANAQNLITLSSQYSNLEIVELDVNDENSVKNCFEQLNQNEQGIDKLYNNAGIIDWSNLLEVTEDSFSKVLQTNLLGALLVLRHALPCLGRSASPWVYNMSSRLGSVELRGNTHLGGAIAYQCSKAGLNMLTKQASIDLGPKGIKVVSITPGWVRTEMGGADAKYNVSESVTNILRVTDHLNLGHNGCFLAEDGTEIPW